MFTRKKTSIHDALDSTTTKVPPKAVKNKEVKDKYEEEYGFSFEPGSTLGDDSTETKVTVYKIKSFFGLKYRSKLTKFEFDNPKNDFSRISRKRFGQLNYEDFEKFAHAAVEYYEKKLLKELEKEQLAQEKIRAEKLKIRRPKCQIE